MIIFMNTKSWFYYIFLLLKLFALFYFMEHFMQLMTGVGVVFKF